MQHDRAVLFAVFAHIGCIKTFRQNEVGLKRAALPVTANRITQNEFKLRSIERAFTRIDFERQASFQCRFTKGCFSLVPDFVRTGTNFWTVRKLHKNVGEAKILVDRLQKVTENLGFRDNLVFGTENMGIILDELAHTHDAMQTARRFISMAAAKFRHTQRQVAIGFAAEAKNLHVARAVHRL